MQVSRQQAQKWGEAVPKAADGVIRSLAQPQTTLAAVVESNPLHDDWTLDHSLLRSSTIIWSGSLSDDLFDAHPANWMRPGHEAFNRRCDELKSQLDRGGGTVLVRPHARHILSDPQSCMRFLLDRQGQPFGIALSPADMLEASMLPEVEDHLQRAFESLGGRCTMLLLHDVRPGSDEEGGLETVPLGQGLLPRETVTALVAACVADQTPIVLRPESLESQLEWIGANVSF